MTPATPTQQLEKLDAIKQDLQWLAANPMLIESGIASLPAVSDNEKFQLLFSSAEQIETAASRLATSGVKQEFEPLGRYFEKLIFALLDANGSIEVVATNKSFSSQKATLGEIDALFKTQDKFHHWEVAFKNYLRYGDDYWGPRGKDVLSRKLGHIKNHQLALTRVPAVTLELEKSFGIESLQSSAYVQGCLFYHPSASHSVLKPELDSILNPLHRRGWWVRADETAEFSRGRKSQWQVFNRKSWMEGPRFALGHHQDRLSTDEFCRHVSNHFSTNDHSILVCEIAESAERSRGFIVSPQWPTFSTN